MREKEILCDCGENYFCTHFICPKCRGFVKNEIYDFIKQLREIKKKIKMATDKYDEEK